MRTPFPVFLFLPLFIVACAAPAECTEADCAALCGDAGSDPAPAAAATAPGSGLSAFESGLVGPVLDDLRGGVRPFNDSGIGICTGNSKDCDEYLGREPGELPPGEYMLRAELRVPDIGDKGTWKVKLDTDCTLTRSKDGSETTTKRSDSKEYTVNYTGEERGYRLSPLRTIKSPNSNDYRKSCSWTLTAPHADGDKVYSGSWVVPPGG
jgi:hypothetical protein